MKKRIVMKRAKIKEKKVAPIAYNFENTKDKIQEANPNLKKQWENLTTQRIDAPLLHSSYAMRTSKRYLNSA